ncbi:YncE family protein [Cytobacillus sp. S13-E01]|uniref:YncE family protein n=1 Tax=Cytobacillus sp. S13-E01 TaxID=3031326 RepID=UPI0023D80181|nr:YncE family protein [Cytobacillus sp. S13-E01]MDF0728040.1 YncE family protein [Cytobacillus sp. S13-E01]
MNLTLTRKGNWIWFLLLVFGLLLTACQNEAKLSTPTPTSDSPQDTVTKLDVPSLNLLMTNSMGDYISFVNPANGTTQKVKVGAAPFGLALAPENRAYVATAEGVAVIDTKDKKRIALIPYRSNINEIEFGEYRAGGMGIAVSPDGSRVFVGVYLPGEVNQLEIIDTDRLEVIDSVPIENRPFQVLISNDGREVYSINHDSYSVTVVDTSDLSARTIEVAPLGRGAFDKPNYGAVDTKGRLLLPFQGEVLAILDPKSGEYTEEPMNANTHLSGVTYRTDDNKLYIIGAGAAGGADKGSSLVEMDLDTMKETIFPLSRPHENVITSPDGRWAFLTGGYTLANYGWDGITILDLKEGKSMELPVDGQPLDIKIIE